MVAGAQGSGGSSTARKDVCCAAPVQHGVPASLGTMVGVAQLNPNASTHLPQRMLLPWAILPSGQTSVYIELAASPPFAGRS